jgi:hypothetical protein
MGIRGTVPHVEISSDGSVKFSTLVEGGATVASQPQERQATSPGAPSPQQADPYNKLFRDHNICRNC